MPVGRFWALAAVLLAYSDPLAAQTSTFTDPGSFFSLALPDGCAVTSRKNLPDFDVYDVLCHAVPQVGIYIGRHPNRAMEGRIIEARNGVLIQVWVDSVSDDEKEQANRIAD